MDKEQDKLSNAEQDTKLLALRQIQARVALGVPVAKACREAGYPRSSYYIDIEKLRAEESAA